MFAYPRFTNAHDGDDMPGSLGAPTATHYEKLGRDRTPARPPVRVRVKRSKRIPDFFVLYVPENASLPEGHPRPCQYQPHSSQTP